MDEVMRKNEILGEKETSETSGRDLTCCVHFVGPGSSSEDEQSTVTRLVSKEEDLQIDCVFKPESLKLATNRSLFEFGHNFEDVRVWLNIEQPSKVPLKTVLRYMLENHLKTTVQIEINKMYFNCHVIVLQSYSKFFMDLKEIPLVVTLAAEKVSQKAFMLIYKWMLSDEPKLERKNIVAVFVAATYLRIEALLQNCWEYFEDSNCFNEVTACIMYIEAKNNPALDIVRNLMLTRIQKFLLTFVATRDFLDIPPKHLVYLLSSDDICVNTEIEVLFIIVRWLGNDWKRRQSYVSRLIGCIRFHLMPLWYLLCVRRLETHKLLKELISRPKVVANLNEAIAQITSSMYEGSIDGTIVDHPHITKKSQHRRWIQDEACPYFHLNGCPNTRDINYSHFEAYLTNLQQQAKNSWAKVELLDGKNPKKCCMMLHKESQ